MPLWGVLLVGYSIVAGFLSVWILRRDGGGTLMFVVCLALGFIIVPLGGLWLIGVNIRNRRWVRKNKAALQSPS